MIIEVDGRKPQIDETVWIAPNATVIGEVCLGPQVGVFYGASVRGDVERITIGAGANVQDGVVLHADPGYPLTIGRNVSVGHNAVLHGCTVGDDCLVGMGAIVLNGATLGDGCLVAAGAVIPEKAMIPSGSLVAGVPGKVRRELAEEARAALVENATAYRTLLTVHRNGRVCER